MKTFSAPLHLIVLVVYGSFAAAAERLEPSRVKASSNCSVSDIAGLHRLATKTIGISYAQARRQFSKAGWKPAPVDELDRWFNGREDLDMMSGSARFFYNRGFVDPTSEHAFRCGHASGIYDAIIGLRRKPSEDEFGLPSRRTSNSCTLSERMGWSFHASLRRRSMPTSDGPLRSVDSEADRQLWPTQPIATLLDRQVVPLVPGAVYGLSSPAGGDEGESGG